MPEATAPVYTWQIHNCKDKPNSYQGRTAQLQCLKDGESHGFCYVETWLYGCCLSGLSKLANLDYMDAQAYPSMALFLSTLSCKMNDPEAMYNKYISKRFMFTVTEGGHGYGLRAELIKHSTKMLEFENWCHQSSTNQMYFLNLKDYK